MIKEKTQLLLKSLPQKLRHHVVPLPEFAAGFAEWHAGPKFSAGTLVDELIADIREQTQVAVKSADFKLETLPAHLFMNFKVINEHGRQLAMGCNLAQLRAELGGQAQQHFQKLTASAALDALSGDANAPHTQSQAQGQIPSQGQVGSESTALYENLTTWNFGKLPELLEIRRRGQTLFGYPALVDRTTHCDVEVFDSPEEAARIHRAGLRRLFALQLREPIRFWRRTCRDCVKCRCSSWRSAKSWRRPGRSRRLRRTAAATRRADRQALRDRHALRATGAFSALSERHRLAADLLPLAQQYQRALSQCGGVADARLAEYR